jgi:hypothetical protein
MKSKELKKIIINSLSSEDISFDPVKKLEDAGVSYSFSKNFREKVMDKLFIAGMVVNREVEFIRSWNLAFYRVALTGVAAIVILLISIFLMQGSLSFNSFLGLSSNYDESIVCLLTGN